MRMESGMNCTSLVKTGFDFWEDSGYCNGLDVLWEWLGEFDLQSSLFVCKISNSSRYCCLAYNLAMRSFK